MADILIIGAGGVGSVVAHKCAQLAKEGAFGKITLASRTLSRCDEIARSVKARLGVDIATAQVDADNVPELCALIRQVKPHTVLNIALPYQDLHIMDACLECGVHYLDTANYEPLDTAKFEYKWQWAYQERFKQAGLTALLGSGFDPGVTNVFSAWVMKHELDEVHVLDIIDCNAGDHGQPCRDIEGIVHMVDIASAAPLCARNQFNCEIGAVFAGIMQFAERLFIQPVGFLGHAVTVCLPDFLDIFAFF